MAILDKLHLLLKKAFYGQEGTEHIDFTALKRFSAKSIPSKVRKNYRSAQRYELHSGQHVYIFENGLFLQIEIVPNAFGTWRELEAFLSEILFAPNSWIVKRWDINVDLEVPFESVFMKVDPSRFRRFFKYSVIEKYMSGQTLEKIHEATWGNLERNQWVVYRKGDLTRVEFRNRLPVKMKLHEVPGTLLRTRAFTKIKLLSLTKEWPKTPQEALKFDHFCLLSKRIGIREARKHIRRIDRNADRSYGKCFKAFNPTKHSLQPIYEARAKEFFNKEKA